MRTPRSNESAHPPTKSNDGLQRVPVTLNRSRPVEPPCPGMLPHERAEISWRGVDWPPIFVYVMIWEGIYQISKKCCSLSDHPKIREMGASYATAFVNATFCSIAGLFISTVLGSADIPERALVIDEPPLDAVTSMVYTIVQSFVGWLIMDLFHVLTHFPSLGGWDTVLHHAGFIVLSLCGYGFRVLPFAVGWLLLGEISTLFLNLRFFMINSGLGETRAMKLTNYAFASTFFLTRVVVMWFGLADMLLHLRPFLLSENVEAPAAGVNTICGFIGGGALLNAFWMVKIVKMATRPVSENRKGKVGSPATIDVRAPTSPQRSKGGLDSPPLTPTYSVSDGSTSELLSPFPPTPSQAELPPFYSPSAGSLGSRVGSQEALQPCDRV